MDRSRIKAISLVSGGLDSTLATRIILDMGIEVVAVNFTSPFCTCTSKRRKELGCKNEALRISQHLGIKIRIVPKGKEYLSVIRNPKYGYGSAMNPCIDCRIFMLRKAKEIMEEEGASFIVTGEVLGQRPMSQRREAILKIERESGLSGKIIRPLSAIHFEPTVFEKEGIVDRSRLLSIDGRGRSVQIELAAKYNITDYPCPAGGCLLTDKRFAEKLRDYFIHHKDDEDYVRQMELLKIGRHFRLPNGAKIIVGRDEYENSRLMVLNRGENYVVESEFPGPIALIFGERSEENLLFAVTSLKRFNNKLPKDPVYFISKNGQNREEIRFYTDYPEDVVKYQLGIDR
ncbi:MAG: hypothetical protein N2746_00785 [Deltaproteobacteria bacterium]|nr:hypothetical protein [Deltaproteobacteria bacterium]